MFYRRTGKCSPRRIVSTEEPHRIIGIGSAFKIGVDSENGHFDSLPIAIQTPDQKFGFGTEFRKSI